MNKKEKLAFGVLAVIAMTGSGFAYGQSVNNVSNTQVIYACVTGVNGNIVRVSNTQKTCPRGTTPISWNMVGPQGIQGIPGAAVAKGEKGDPGLAGEQGPRGLQGEGSGFSISSGGASYKLIQIDDGGGANAWGIKIDGVWWTVTYRSFDEPFLLYDTFDNTRDLQAGFSSDVLVYRSSNCTGLFEGYLRTYRSEEITFPNGQMTTLTYIRPTFNNVAVKLFGDHYSASFSKTVLSEVKSYWDGLRCTSGMPLEAIQGEPTEYRIHKLEQVNRPDLVFDSPIELN
jgi:hypothetical protein